MTIKRKISGVYKITCTETGRCYIGQSGDITLRWNQHLDDLMSKRHVNLALQEARTVSLERSAYVAKIDPAGRLAAMDTHMQELHRHASASDAQYKHLVAQVSARVGFDIGAGCTIDTETGKIIQHEKKE